MRKSHYFHFPILLLITLCYPDYTFAQRNGPGSGKREGRVNGRRINIETRTIMDTAQCAAQKYRSIDGTCNNISRSSRMEYGATDIVLTRAIAPEYGASDPFNALGGENRPSPRAISNRVVAESSSQPSIFRLSAWVFTWGQFLDHDITLTPEVHVEYAPVPLPPDENLFTLDIPFFRSEVFEQTGQNEPRQQLNLITAWIDGSMVYGSEKARADWLRTHQNGKLKVSQGNLLPFNTLDGEYGSPVDSTAPSMAGADANGKMWVAGDVRAGEQVGLTCLHTLFVREHNRICDELMADGLTVDEDIYQEARKRVIALIQKITYQEFLPAMGVSLSRYDGYKERVSPDITNEFATAGYRLGHTMVAGAIPLLDANCQTGADTALSLISAYFNPEVLRTYGLELYLKGLSVEVQSEVDPFIVDELRNFLFSNPNNSPIVGGLDLAALNIQRGRDHGLPDYNTLREHYTGRAARDFGDITHDASIRSKLEQAYQGQLNEIDAWVGLLCEDHVNGSSLGPTLHAILKDQFERLRDGDRFYYEHELSRSELSEIDNTRLSEVIMRNSNLSDLQGNVMFADACSNDPLPRNEKLEQQLEIFPNPTKGEVRIKRFKKDLRIEAYSIIDVSGMSIINRREYKRGIDLSRLEPGTYFIQIFTNKGTASKQVVRKN